MSRATEFIEATRTPVIKDFLNYERVLKNERQSVVADRFGIPNSTYAHLESAGWASLRIALLPKIADYIGCSITELVDHVDTTVDRKQGLEKQLRTSLYDRHHSNRSSLYRGQLILTREYHFMQHPRYGQTEKAIYCAKDLPQAQIWVNYNENEVDLSTPTHELFVAQLAALPFQRLLAIRHDANP